MKPIDWLAIAFMLALLFAWLMDLWLGKSDEEDERETW